MNRRGGEVPMDFAWENNFGPVDENSPFLAHAKKRTHSAFNSPSKQAPSLRAPSSQASFLFSQTPSLMNGGGDRSMPAPSASRPGFKPDAFNTPRKMEIDFSSGGETPETPDNNSSVDVTPESNRMERGSPFKPTSKTAVPFKAGNTSPGKERRMSFLKDLFKRSPTATRSTAVAKSSDVYSKKAERRHKRRARDITKKRKNESVDLSDDEPSELRKKLEAVANGEGKEPTATGSVVAAILSFIDSHPTLPHILSVYAQFLFNLFLVLFAIYVIWSFWSTITSDVNAEAKKAVGEILAEMAVCAQNYRENRCDPKTRMPALTSVCSNWEKCMNQDPEAVGRARVGAHTFARVLNSFVEPISYKAMIFTILLIFGSVTFSNFAFTAFRNRQNADMHAHPNVYMPHPTPQRYPSGSMDSWAQQGGYNNFRGQHLGMEPAPSVLPPGDESPSRRIEYVNMDATSHEVDDISYRRVVKKRKVGSLEVDAGADVDGEESH